MVVLTEGGHTLCQKRSWRIIDLARNPEGACCNAPPCLPVEAIKLVLVQSRQPDRAGSVESRMSRWPGGRLNRVSCDWNNCNAARSSQRCVREMLSYRHSAALDDSARGVGSGALS